MVEDLRRLKTPFALAIGVARVPVLVSPLSIWLRPWSDPVFLTDVAAFWTGSCMVREGEGSLLSDMEAQRGVQQSLRAGEALTDSSYVDLTPRIGAFTPPPGSCVSPEMMVTWWARLLSLWPRVPDGAGSVLVWILGISTLLASLRAWRGLRDPGSSRFPVHGVALKVATLLASPHSHFNGLALLIPPSSILLVHWSRGGTPTKMLGCTLPGGYLLASAVWWVSLLSSPGRTLFCVLAPFLAPMLVILVGQSRRGKSSWVASCDGWRSLRLDPGTEAR